ncbi:MAG: hypothetical protein M1451_12455, partial [Acidobacteria bacterium]|nr:hypothetical protein [Acidobacteriota bacterium]
MRLNKRTSVVLASVLLLALVASAGIVWARHDDAVIVPEGTAIRVSLDHSISSATSQPGDAFEASIAKPILVNGMTVIPAGSRARLACRAAVAADSTCAPGVVSEMTCVSTPKSAR